MKKIKLIIGVLVIASLTSCAAYRTNSKLSFKSTEFKRESADFKILEGDLIDQEYTVIKPVMGVVKQLTIFHKPPTSSCRIL